jgi:hypothetical protein
MPPSPTITAELDADAWVAFCETNLITPPTVAIRKGRLNVGGRPCFGTYNHRSNHIEITLGMAQYDFDSLRSVLSELHITLFHELRHAWQVQFKGEKWLRDNAIEKEVDAEQWGNMTAVDHKRMIRVRRKFHGSGLGRIARTEANVRQNV